MYGEIGAGGQCWGQSWNAAVGEIRVFMVVKQFSMLGLEVLTILTKKMTSPPFFFFFNNSSLSRPQALVGEALRA